MKAEIGNVHSHYAIVNTAIAEGERPGTDHG